MNNLKKFNTEADYSAATLNYPNVSWVVSGDTLHYAKEAPTPTVEDKVIVVSNGDGTGDGQFVLFNCGSSGIENAIESITLDNVEVDPITCFTDSTYDATQVHTAKYTLSTDTIDDWLTGDLGVTAGASEPATVDVLFPNQIASIGPNFPSNFKNLVVLATTPPYVEGFMSAWAYNDGFVYVPDSVVNDYKEDSGWGEMHDFILPISQYSGNLPL